MNALALLVALAAQEPVAPAPATATSTAAEAAPERRRVERVAVYEIENADQPRLARFVTENLVVELRKLQGLSVVSMDEIRAVLEHEATKQLAGCDQESCLAEVADALGVDTLVVGTLAFVGDETTFALRRIDQRAASGKSATRRMARVDGTEVLAAIGPVVEELFPDHPISAGQTRGVADAAVVRLNPPPIPIWATALVGGGGIALLGAGGVFGAVAWATQGEKNALIAQGQSAPVEGRAVKDAIARGQAFAITADALYVAGLVVIVAAGVMAPITDWFNDAAE